ncbi:MAG TPA: GAF domain-containing protein [Edaphocola sp.]|nr:GAF domain-containing protein [Edaphocola sp.]
MSEELTVFNGTKAEQYEHLLPQIRALISTDGDMIAHMANIAAALQQQFKWFWVGFYRVINNELVVGPFQGPVACVSIAKGKGVCGKAWQESKTIIVPDVDQFPGHIACNSASRSEIAVPVIKNDIITGVLDVDSDALNTFDDTDAQYLAQITSLLAAVC